MIGDYSREPSKRHFIYYDFTAYPSDEILSSPKAHDLVSAICIIRQQLKQCKKDIKILTHDADERLGSSSIFACLLDLMRKYNDGTFKIRKWR